MRDASGPVEHARLGSTGTEKNGSRDDHVGEDLLLHAYIRPSDRRGPEQYPRPQCAFEKSVLNVSCNSHQVSQLAAFFIDP